MENMSDQRIEYRYKADNGERSTVTLTLHNYPAVKDDDRRSLLACITRFQIPDLIRGPIEVPPSREDGKAALIAELKAWLDGKPYQLEEKIKSIIERIEAL